MMHKENPFTLSFGMLFFSDHGCIINGRRRSFYILGEYNLELQTLLVLASTIQISCPCPSLLVTSPTPTSENLVSVSSVSGNFWHENYHQAMKHFLFMYVESRQCALDLENPSQNCLNASILREGTDTNVKNQ